jgi:hypothetical protein
MEKSPIKTYFAYTNKYQQEAATLRRSAELTTGELDLRPVPVKEEIDDYLKLSNSSASSLTKVHSALGSRLKLNSIIRAIKDNEGETIIYCDADLVFLSPILGRIPNPPWDICAPQYLARDIERLDWGFLIINCTRQVLNFFNHALEEAVSHSNVSLSTILGSASAAIHTITLPRYFANFTNRGMLEGGEAVLYHHNKPRRNPNVIKASLAREIHILNDYKRFDRSDRRLRGDTKEERMVRQERLEKEEKSGEAAIEDFIVKGCVDPAGNPLDVNCNKIWEDYQEELHKPGCKSCIKRKIIKKYLNKVEDLIKQADGL